MGGHFPRKLFWVRKYASEFIGYGRDERKYETTSARCLENELFVILGFFINGTKAYVRAINSS